MLDLLLFVKYRLTKMFMLCVQILSVVINVCRSMIIVLLHEFYCCHQCPPFWHHSSVCSPCGLFRECLPMTLRCHVVLSLGRLSLRLLAIHCSKHHGLCKSVIRNSAVVPHNCILIVFTIVVVLSIIYFVYPFLAPTTFICRGAH